MERAISSKKRGSDKRWGTETVEDVNRFEIWWEWVSPIRFRGILLAIELYRHLQHYVWWGWSYTMRISSWEICANKWSTGTISVAQSVLSCDPERAFCVVCGRVTSVKLEVHANIHSISVLELMQLNLVNIKKLQKWKSTTKKTEFCTEIYAVFMDVRNIFCSDICLQQSYGFLTVFYTAQ